MLYICIFSNKLDLNQAITCFSYDEKNDKIYPRVSVL